MKTDSSNRIDYPIRVLHVVARLYPGGVENFIMNMYRNIDKEKIQFDFLTHRKKHRAFAEEILRLGGRIYEIPVREDNNYFRYLIELNRFFRSHPEYQIVYGHMESLGIFYHTIAKFNRVKIRIAHSHTAQAKNSRKFAEIMKFICSRPWRFCVTHRFACSKEAGNYMFGKKRFAIIHNAIDLEKFKFNNQIRSDLRNRLCIENGFVIGHVGRFDPEKNHEFIIDIFYIIRKKNPECVLLLIGEGELEPKIRQKVNSLGLGNNVIFLGARSDVNRLYQAMDVFVLPSLWEGLGMAAIEAQAAGLRVFASNVVPEEARVTNLLSYLPLSGSAENWADEILKYSQGYERRNTSEEITDKGYNIVDESKKLQEFYLSICSCGE